MFHGFGETGEAAAQSHWASVGSDEDEVVIMADGDSEESVTDSAAWQDVLGQLHDEFGSFQRSDMDNGRDSTEKLGELGVSGQRHERKSPSVVRDPGVLHIEEDTFGDRFCGDLGVDDLQRMLSRAITQRNAAQAILSAQIPSEAAFNNSLQTHVLQQELDRVLTGLAQQRAAHAAELRELHKQLDESASLARSEGCKVVDLQARLEKQQDYLEGLQISARQCESLKLENDRLRTRISAMAFDLEEQQNANERLRKLQDEGASQTQFRLLDRLQSKLYNSEQTIAKQQKMLSEYQSKAQGQVETQPSSVNSSCETTRVQTEHSSGLHANAEHISLFTTDGNDLDLANKNDANHGGEYVLASHSKDSPSWVPLIGGSENSHSKSEARQETLTAAVERMGTKRADLMRKIAERKHRRQLHQVSLRSQIDQTQETQQLAARKTFEVENQTSSGLVKRSVSRLIESTDEKSAGMLLDTVDSLEAQELRSSVPEPGSSNAEEARSTAQLEVAMVWKPV